MCRSEQLHRYNDEITNLRSALLSKLASERIAVHQCARLNIVLNVFFHECDPVNFFNRVFESMTFRVNTAAHST